MGVREVRLLHLDRLVVLDNTPASDDYVVLTPTAILDCGDLCLVRVSDTGDWYMGQLDESDGSIICWACYGDDLERAIEGL
jgi:hypothetical protein